MNNRLIHGDSLVVLPGLPDNCIDTIITDPPYGLGFMGKDWDHGVPGTRFWKNALRVAKPGATLLAFGGTRTHHRLTCAIEDAGWLIRDCMMWLYGSGFPKSHNIAKGIDKSRGNKRTVVGSQAVPGYAKKEVEMGKQNRSVYEFPKTEGYTEWEGYGTALKPAWEPIIVAMKPCEGTFAQNAEKWGVGGLWIDGGRVGTEQRETSWMSKNSKDAFNRDDNWEPKEGKTVCQGRWPANVILDEEAGAILDEQSGGASRFFYCAKASKAERNAGCDGLEEKRGSDDYRPGDDGTAGIQSRLHGATKKGANHHPTVKPLKLMEYLCKLTKTPTGGVVLDMFGGSGTTALACINTGRPYCIIERELPYCQIASKRLGGQAIETYQPPKVETAEDARQRAIADAVRKMKGEK